MGVSWKAPWMCHGSVIEVSWKCGYRQHGSVVVEIVPMCKLVTVVSSTAPRHADGPSEGDPSGEDGWCESYLLGSSRSRWRR